MPSFSTEVAHQLGQQEAMERLKDYVEEIRRHYQDQVTNLEGSWEDNSLSVSFTSYTFKINATLTVEDELR